MRLGQEESSPSNNMMSQTAMRYSFCPPVFFSLRIMEPFIYPYLYICIYLHIIHLPLTSCHSGLHSIGEIDFHHENKMAVSHKQYPEFIHIFKTPIFLEPHVIHISDKKNCFVVNVSKKVQPFLTTQTTVHRRAKEDKRIHQYSSDLLDRLHRNPEG